MIPTVIMLTVWRWKDIIVLALPVPIIIVHFISYIFLFVLLAFMQDPFLMTLYYCMLISVIYFITFWHHHYYVCAMKTLRIQWRYCAVVINILRIGLLGLALIFGLCADLLISGVFALGAFSNSQTFQALILSLLIGLLSFLYLNLFIRWHSNVSS